MSPSLRALAVASSAALLVAGVATSASAAPSTGTSFTVSPSYGATGSTVVLQGSGFASTDTVKFGGGIATTPVSATTTKITVTVPAGAKTGRVEVVETGGPVKGGLFTVQQPTTMAMTLSKSTLTYTKTLTVTATLKNATTHAAVAHQSARLQHEAAGSSSWGAAKGTSIQKTSSAGSVSWTLTPSATGRYRVHFLTTPAVAGGISPAAKLRVLPLVQLDSIHSIPSRTSSDITGTIRPQVSGQVYLQRLVNGHWKHAGSTAINHGRFTFAVTPTSTGVLQYRVIRHADGSHGYKASRTLHLQVIDRTLSMGDTGPDVLALEKRLRALHYDTGKVSDYYSIDTLHAVTAFEKVQGIDRDGQAGPQVQKALNHPKVPHLRHPISSGYAVEVDLTKQILMISKNGKIWRILDTSTAGGYQFQGSDGQTETAITPTGHFTIQYKITGWHKSSLGELYYPSYFTDTGYAIHGEGNGNNYGNVPPVAASHGCVRITNNAVLRYYYHVFTVGTSVWIYK